MNYFIYYLILVNVIALFLMKVDKSAAQRRNRRRISEKNLLAIAFCGGSIGVTFGMYLFNHKTRKLLFKLGLPIIIVSQVIVFIYVQNYL